MDRGVVEEDLVEEVDVVEEEEVEGVDLVTVIVKEILIKVMVCIAGTVFLVAAYLVCNVLYCSDFWILVPDRSNIFAFIFVCTQNS